MEMDGGWLCHAAEQTDSSLNAFSLRQAPRNEARLSIGSLSDAWVGPGFSSERKSSGDVNAHDEE
ncbi:hypothetical protein EYF80_033324 [Liparis tanakae]|uniref:Uncharacterized protein n=1 Tax=Liparis tanakae TaxID=230148 RepID=A0A4Z2GV20_9TELE|nr:hypothetical protein EYF80_033324 [Liparis tanakae]